MSKEVGVPRIPGDAEARKGMGLKLWDKGEVFRSGKTRREHANGAHANHLRNREERREANKRKAGKQK